MSAKSPIGYVAINPKHGIPIWTGKGSSKLYSSAGSAKAAIKNSGWREGEFIVEPVYLGGAE